MQIKIGSKILTITLEDSNKSKTPSLSHVKKIVIQAMKGQSPGDNHHGGHQISTPQLHWKIPAIKTLRDAYATKDANGEITFANISLKESKDLVELVEAKYNLSQKYLKGVK